MMTQEYTSISKAIDCAFQPLSRLGNVIDDLRRLGFAAECDRMEASRMECVYGIFLIQRKALEEKRMNEKNTLDRHGITVLSSAQD